jgi:NADP-dependent 3-hydroxy acid dehydrogenase YdfG
MSISLTGRRVVVTGASSGIGEGIAIALQRAGAKVGLIARRQDRLDALRAQLGPDVYARVVDVRDFDAMEIACAELAEELGGLDGVVANAGVSLVSDLTSGNAQEWKEGLDINLWGTFTTIRATLPHFVPAGPRDVVLISSTASRTPVAELAVYSATKRGMAAIAESLRLANAPDGIRTCVVYPGDVVSEGSQRTKRDEDILEEFIEKRKTFGQHAPIPTATFANAVCFVFGQPEGTSINELTIRPTGQLVP